MSYSDNALSFQSAISAPQPASSPGLVRRDFSINFTTSQFIYSYTGPAAGLGNVICAGGVLLGNASTSAATGFLAVNNSENGNFLACDTVSGVKFITNMSTACTFRAWTLSTA